MALPFFLAFLRSCFGPALAGHPLCADRPAPGRLRRQALPPGGVCDRARRPDVPPEPGRGRFAGGRGHHFAPHHRRGWGVAMVVLVTLAAKAG